MVDLKVKDIHVKLGKDDEQFLPKHESISIHICTFPSDIRYLKVLCGNTNGAARQYKIRNDKRAIAALGGIVKDSFNPLPFPDYNQNPEDDE